MEIRNKGVGSVRLTDKQYEEMERLGLENESAYVRYKIQAGENRLSRLQKVEPSTINEATPGGSPPSQIGLEDKLTIQRLQLEKERLVEKLDAIQRGNEEALGGVPSRVHALLQEELQRRDFQALQKEASAQSETIKELKEKLEKAKKQSESKQEEIEALLKKLSLVELGRTLLPGAISGLAREYPKEMKGIAGTLGRLGLDNEVVEAEVVNEDKELLQILEYLKEAFSAEQFQEVLELLIRLSEGISMDAALIQKVSYYLQKLAPGNSKPEHANAGEEENFEQQFNS